MNEGQLVLPAGAITGIVIGAGCYIAISLYLIYFGLGLIKNRNPIGLLLLLLAFPWIITFIYGCIVYFKSDKKFSSNKLTKKRK